MHRLQLASVCHVFFTLTLLWKRPYSSCKCDIRNAASGVPVDQIVQMVGALREHLMTSAPDAPAAAGRPGRPPARRKRRNKSSEAATDAPEADAAAQVTPSRLLNDSLLQTSGSQWDVWCDMRQHMCVWLLQHLFHGSVW